MCHPAGAPQSPSDKKFIRKLRGLFRSPAHRAQALLGAVSAAYKGAYRTGSQGPSRTRVARGCAPSGEVDDPGSVPAAGTRRVPTAEAGEVHGAEPVAFAEQR